MQTLAAIGMAIVAVFAAFTVRYRDSGHVKPASPRLLLVIFLGVELILLGVCLLYFSYRRDPAMCSARQWLPAVAYSLSVGVLVFKTRRLQLIFCHKGTARVTITESMIFKRLAGLLLLDLIGIAMAVAAWGPCLGIAAGRGARGSVRDGRG